MDRKTLETIKTVFKCSKCGKFKELKDMVKVPKSSIISIFDKSKQSYNIICNECVKE